MPLRPLRPHLPARVLIALLLVMQCCTGAWAQAPAVARESAVKAAFLYKFAAFVEWPTGTFQRPDDPIVLGVAGNDAVAADLEQVVAGRMMEGRPVAVRRLRDGEPVPALHVLMIGQAADQRVRSLSAATPGPVLVVTEQDNGLRLGGVLNFVTEGGRVRFSASLPAADARSLRLSARLLAVAQAVEGRTR
jgi:hypothetical protein